MDILVMSQWASLVLYFIVFMYAGITTGTVRKCLVPDHFKHLVQSALVAISVQAGMYITLQTDCIINTCGLPVNTLANSLWLGHEILSGVFLFVIISIIRIGIKESINNLDIK